MNYEGAGTFAVVGALIILAVLIGVVRTVMNWNDLDIPVRAFSIVASVILGSAGIFFVSQIVL